MNVLEILKFNRVEDFFIIYGFVVTHPDSLIIARLRQKKSISYCTCLKMSIYRVMLDRAFNFCSAFAIDMGCETDSVIKFYTQ